MAPSLDIFQFENLPEFLKKTEREAARVGRRPASHRVWAKRLGYQSPRSVGMVFRGKRLPSLVMAHRLCSYLQLNSDERDYFFSLLAREKTQGKMGKFEDEDLLRKRNLLQNQNQKILSDATFAYISSWYHIVIRQLLLQISDKSSNFKCLPNPKVLINRLKKKISREDLINSIEILKTLQLVPFLSKKPTERDGARKESFLTTQDIPSAAIRNHHKQMMFRAQEALDEVDVNDREMTSATFCFSRKNIPEAKRMIRAFRDRLEDQLTDPEGSDVFQFNIQFFPHTTERTTDAKVLKK